MQITITIDLDNAAFDPNPGDELARVFKHMAAVVKGISEFESYVGRGSELCNVRDANGNTIGNVTIEKSTPTS